jgi:di/tricarboxylate transporter
MHASIDKIDKTYCIKWLISLFIPLLIYLTPTTENFTAEIRLFLTFVALIILIIAFDLLEVTIAAIALPTLFVISGLAPAGTAFAPWTYTTMWLIVGTFVLAGALEECGLLKRIAFWCIKRCGGTFNGTMYGLMIVGTILAWCTFCNSYMIVITLTYGICKAMGLEKSKESAVVMMVGSIGVTSCMEFVYNPLMMSLMTQGVNFVLPDFQVFWYNQLLISAPVIVFYFIFIFVLTRLYKTKNIQIAGGKEYFETEYKALGQMSVAEKKAAIMLLALMIYLLTNPIHHLSTDWGFMVIPYLMFFPGIGVASRNALKSSINFGAVAFCAACFSIGAVGTSLGLSNLISTGVTPVLSGLGKIPVLYMTMLFGMFANLVLTPSAMMSCLPPIIAQVAVDIGMNPLAPLFALYFSCDMIFLPHEVPAVLILFTLNLISMGDFVKMSIIKIVTLLICIGVFLIPYWYLIGIL